MVQPLSLLEVSLAHPYATFAERAGLFRVRALAATWLTGILSINRSTMAWPSFPVAPVINDHKFLLFRILRAASHDGDLARGALLGRDPSHFAKTIIREVLGLPFFDGLQNETGNKFGLVAIGVIGRRSAAGRIPHPVLAEVRRRD